MWLAEYPESVKANILVLEGSVGSSAAIGRSRYCLNAMPGTPMQALGREAISSTVMCGTPMTGGAGSVIDSFSGVLRNATRPGLGKSHGKLMPS